MSAIVKSRMFAFKDLGGRNVALRPEFTASVARLVATTLRNEPRPFRLFSVGSIYRYDEPQRGRYREIRQTNYELMGSSRPEADAEILLLTYSLMRAAGLKRFAFKVGHVGVLRGILTQEKLVDKVQGAVISYVELVRSDPWGVFHTSNVNYILGIATQLDGPLINRADGHIEVPLKAHTELWLYACDDGANRPVSSYTSRLRIGQSQWVSATAGHE